LSATGYADDVDSGSLQQSFLTTGLKTKFNGIRDYATQFTDLNIDRKYSPSASMFFADVNDPLSYGHFMHLNTLCQIVDKKKPAGNPAGF
jgi:hypothetical protein